MVIVYAVIILSLFLDASFCYPVIFVLVVNIFEVSIALTLLEVQDYVVKS